MSFDLQRLRDNLARVQERIAAAAENSGRSPNSVRLIAVTKYVPPELAEGLIAAGCDQLGESRPQELWRKAEAFRSKNVTWHLIGHLQRNKIARTLPLISWFHAGDSLRLLEAIETAALAQAVTVSTLIEVNISGDLTKHGFPPEALDDLLPRLAEFSAVRIKGLMGMASLEGGTDQAQRDFDRLRALRDRLLERDPAYAPMLEELSMGMSGDFEQAIAAGSTMVRVGSALFEGLET